ncbi:MAG: sugar phosphate isomerase/epimerase [Clostridiales bacterium]|nr:sugar phosphate isomerase/epimerase [Clostridiales bacterium]
MKIAIQLYTLREHCNTGEELLSVLEKVKEAGYDGVEFAGVFGLDAPTLKQALHRLNLTPLAAHQSMDDLENRLEELLLYHRELGSRALVCAFAETGSPEELDRIERLLIRSRQQAAQYGIEVMYHNHSHEFVEQMGIRPIDAIKRCSPLELDSYWAFHSGVDAGEYLRENASRIGLLHLKDGNSSGVPCAIGEGCNHIQSILDAAAEIGLDWVIVENDNPVPDGLSDMVRSIQNLKTRYSF